VAAATRDGLVAIWDTHSGKELTRFRTGAPVQSVDFSRDGSRVASGGLSGVEQVWDVTDEAPAPAEVAAFTRCHAPYALYGNGLVAIELLECPSPP